MRKLLAMLFCFACLLCVRAGAVSLEQVQPVMPEISVYIHDNGDDLTALAKEDIQATLDGEALTVEDLAPSEEGIFYAFLIDISRSISPAHLEAAKQAVLSTYQQMRPQDQLAVISFGNEVRFLLSGGEDADTVRKTVNALACTDNNTCFYDAMNALVKAAAAKTEMRRVAVVVSDGIDDTKAGMTQGQLEEVLRQGGVAVYALAVDSAPAAALAAFKNFIEVSGGSLYTFSPANASQMLGQLLTRIDAIWRLNLRAGSNIADGKTRALEIRFGSLGTVSTRIRPVNWVPDDKPPYIVSLSTDTSAGTVSVTFSEAMLGLDNPDCFRLQTPDGKGGKLRLVSSGADTVTLGADSLSTDAGWALECTGLTDASMEKNVMPACTVPLAGLESSPAASSGASSAGADAVQAGEQAKRELLRTVLILAGAAAVAAAALAVALGARHRRNRVKPEKDKRSAEKQSVRFFFHSHSDDQKKS